MVVLPLNTLQESEMEVLDGLIVVILLGWPGTRFIHRVLLLVKDIVMPHSPLCIHISPADLSS